MIKAVLFDVDGVLIDSFHANYTFFHNLFSKAGYTFIPKKEYVSMYHMSMKDVIKRITKSDSEKEITRIWEMGSKRAVPYPLHLLQLHKGVIETIKTLHKTYKLGIVTSRIKNSIFEFQELGAIQMYFSTVIGYEDTENHKPDPEPLLFAARELSVSPSEVVYVGDLENDLQAAQAAGMKVIIFSSTPLGKADRTTSSFTNIPALISSLHG